MQINHTETIDKGNSDERGMSKLRGLGWVGHPLEGFFNILQTQVFLVAWADWNVKCHVSNESVLVSLSLRSEEVLDG